MTNAVSVLFRESELLVTCQAAWAPRWTVLQSRGLAGPPPLAMCFSFCLGPLSQGLLPLWLSRGPVWGPSLPLAPACLHSGLPFFSEPRSAVPFHISRWDLGPRGGLSCSCIEAAIPRSTRRWQARAHARSAHSRGRHAPSPMQHERLRLSSAPLQVQTLPAQDPVLDLGLGCPLQPVSLRTRPHTGTAGVGREGAASPARGPRLHSSQMHQGGLVCRALSSGPSCDLRRFETASGQH